MLGGAGIEYVRVRGRVGVEEGEGRVEVKRLGWRFVREFRRRMIVVWFRG